jgi:hypothetical protein
LKHPVTILLSGGTTMHESAFRKVQLFFRTVLAPFENLALDVLDVGSAVVAGGHASNLEAFANPHWCYIGLDIEAGPNIDLVVTEPHYWREVADASFDIVACSQVAARQQPGVRTHRILLDHHSGDRAGPEAGQSGLSSSRRAPARSTAIVWIAGVSTMTDCQL